MVSRGGPNRQREASTHEMLMPDVPDTPILPAHIEDTVKAIARLHAEHYERATPLQKFVDRLTARAARPEFVAVVTIVVVCWMASNSILMVLGRQPWDQPPFFWMQGVVGLAALYMTLLILATQRREDQLASHREQLTLELGILSEQKSAKMIALLEELRRDQPNVPDRIDREAIAMSEPADPQAVLDAIKDAQQGPTSPETPPITNPTTDAQNA